MKKLLFLFLSVHLLSFSFIKKKGLSESTSETFYFDYDTLAPSTTTDQLIDNFIDEVSKSGSSPPNLPMKADGLLNGKSEKTRSEVQEWLNLNGEAIYAARPWLVVGEGPTSNKFNKEYTSHDLRFTQKGNDLYVFVLDWPADGKVEIESMGIKSNLLHKQIAEINLLGATDKISWEFYRNHLQVNVPKKKPCDFAQVLKIKLAEFDFDAAPGPVEPSWQSIEAFYQCPDWFRDAKFGIYMHWGLNSVSGFNGHYARFMYHQQDPQQEGSGFKKWGEQVYQYHVDNFGHPSKFGYKDFIPRWQANKFDALALAKFYKEIGARYIGVMAVHHDNFDLYNSTHQPWNSYRMGPKIDIVGEWQKACEAVGVKFAITSHLSNGFHEHVFYQGESDYTGPLARVPYDTQDLANDGLYGKRTKDRLARLPAFTDNWYLRTKELMDNYHPDLFYLDGGLPHGEYGLNLLAHYYNSSYKRFGGKQQVVFNVKGRPIDSPGITPDIERSQTAELVKQPWQVDTSVNPGWFYTGGKQSTAAGEEVGQSTLKNKDQGNDMVSLSAGVLVDNLIDVVSKNGNMLLNVGLRPDGSLPENFRKELEGMGAWLKINGEAIFETRPWEIYGEGTTVVGAEVGSFNENNKPMSASDIRFTTKKNALYVHFLDWPGAHSVVTVRSLSKGKLRGIESVKMLATSEPLKWSQDEKGMHITMPGKKTGEFAYVVKIIF
jgi:alpha-L-fucosidase